MTWGPCFMYYYCLHCGKKFKYAVDLIPFLGSSFGTCPCCGSAGILEQEGARIPADSEYEEVE